jgi:hypothetical protein
MKTGCVPIGVSMLLLGTACGALDGTRATKTVAGPGAEGDGFSDSSSPIPPAAADSAAQQDTDPSRDENLVFIQQDGFQTTYFALDCRSIAEDGSVIDGATNSPLPVGGGHTLECHLERFPSRATTRASAFGTRLWPL